MKYKVFEFFVALCAFSLFFLLLTNAQTAITKVLSWLPVVLYVLWIWRKKR